MNVDLYIRQNIPFCFYNFKSQDNIFDLYIDASKAVILLKNSDEKGNRET